MSEMADRTAIRNPPLAPVAFVGLMALLAVLSIVTGIVDVFVPALMGDEPFGLLLELVEVFGPAYLFIHILVHNAGLACLVPGIGLTALAFERKRANRVLGARILLLTVAMSLLVAFEYIVQARERFDLTIALPLLAIEGLAVLVLAWRGYIVLKEYVPTPRVGWSLVHPARELAPWAVGTHSILAVAAVFEVALVMGMVG